MTTITDLKKVLREFNRDYPRPALEPLEVSKPLNISTEYHKPYPNGDLPGVYIICKIDGTILRVGKASCSRVIAARLNAYFKWNKDGTAGIHIHPGYEEAKTVYTIGVPRDRAFEAPAIEEYLISRLDIPYNHVGRRKP